MMVNEKFKIVIAHGHSSLETFHSLLPFISLAKNINKYDMNFVDYNNKNLYKYSGDIIILVRKFHQLDIRNNKNIEHMISYINNIKKRFSKVIYFDDSAAVSHILFFLVPHVDSYWVRGLLKNNNLYSESLYGGRTYSQYYNQKYNVEDENIYLSPSNKDKFPPNIEIAWNIGIGCYPTDKKSILNIYYSEIRKFSCFLSMLPSIKPLSFLISKYIKEMINTLSQEVLLSKKTKLVSARFSSKGYYNSIAFHRDLVLKKIQKNELFLKGRTSKWNYIQECNHIYGMLSPFGWGEICYRDFEATLGGNLLLKPNMDHIETWPNIYTEDSYFKLDWNFNNLDKIREILSNENFIFQRIMKSRMIYLNAILNYEKRLENLINSLFN